MSYASATPAPNTVVKSKPDGTIDPAWYKSQGYLAKSVAGSIDVTLTDDEAKNAVIDLTGAIGANINVILPAWPRGWFIYNNTNGASYTVTVKTPSGTGATVTQTKRAILVCDGFNIFDAIT